MRVVTHLNSLKFITLRKWCTDKILNALSMFNPLIEYLDIASSEGVTNESVTSLLTMKALVTVNLTDTLIDIKGFFCLLAQSNRLRYIGEDHQHLDAFEYVCKWYPRKVAFNIEYVSMSAAEPNCLDILKEMCPQIKSLKLQSHLENIKFKELLKLKLVQKLHIYGCLFQNYSLNEYFKQQGELLTEIQIEYVYELSFEMLIILNLYCIHLKSIILKNCIFTEDNFDRSTQIQKRTFRFLKIFVFLATGPDFLLEYVLIRSPKLEEISLSDDINLSDNLFKNIFCYNSFPFLEKIQIFNSKQLSAATVYRIICSCSSLKSFSSIFRWKGISSSELTAIQKFVKYSGLDLLIE